MVLLAVFIGILVSVGAHPFNPKLDKLWNDYKVEFNKHYDIDDGMRRLIWEKAVNKITEHNLKADLGVHSYRLGVNKFTDMTNEEYVKLLRGPETDSASSCLTSRLYPPKKRVPDEIDWTQKGIVPPVKNQGPCGSITAFTTLSSLESQYAKKNGHFVSLSLQNLLDCCGSTQGCTGGGSIEQYFICIIRMGGIDSDTSYPPGKEGECHFNKSGIVLKCKGCVLLPSGDEETLKIAVATIGPIATYIDASNLDFQLYSGGVYDNPDCSSTMLDHSMLIVGYGTEDGKDFWLLQNSWGPDWGLHGYIKMSRNKGNQCGIATAPLYPII